MRHQLESRRTPVAEARRIVRPSHRRCPARIAGLLALALALAAAGLARGARVKDITSIKGVRSNHLYGFGLVIGLAQTGDGGDFTSEVARNMLKNLRVGRGLSEVDSGNLSAVWVAVLLRSRSAFLLKALASETTTVSESPTSAAIRSS